MLTDAPRYLLKNVDSFAGFGHCVGTFVAGITIADRHNLQLIHRPLQAAHGLGYAFGDFFMSDGRIVPPVTAPTFAVTDGALWVDGRRTSIYVLADRKSMSADAGSIQEAAQGLPGDTMLWLRKGRFSLREDDPTAAPVAMRYAGLWLRERFWQAFLARSAWAAAPGGPAASSPIRVVVHVRRGDVPYLGPKTGKPHPHFVESSAVLEVLRGCRDALGAAAGARVVLELCDRNAPPVQPDRLLGHAACEGSAAACVAYHVGRAGSHRVGIRRFRPAGAAWASAQLDVETERGWLPNDTAAVRQLLPSARINLGDDRRPHLAVEALMRMAPPAL